MAAVTLNTAHTATETAVVAQNVSWGTWLSRTVEDLRVGLSIAFQKISEFVQPYFAQAKDFAAANRDQLIVIGVTAVATLVLKSVYDKCCYKAKN